MRTLCFLLLLTLNTLTTFSQWTAPHAVDTAAVFFSQGRLPMSIAVGPQREVAIVPLRTDTLVCYFSTDNGRNFSRSVVAYGWRSGFGGGMIANVDGVAFDSQSHLFIFWRMMKYDEVPSWYSFRVSKSTDQGNTFSLVWDTPYFGGLTWSSLTKGGFSIDSQDRVHCVWDSVDFGRPTAYTYTWFPSSDSSYIHNFILPALPASGLPASADVFAQGDSVHVALSAKMQAYPRAGLYYLHSTDGGNTFSSVIPVDTINARNPTLVQQPGNGVFLVHAVAPLSGYEDTALIVRRKLDSLFSPPIGLVRNLGSNFDPIPVRSHDSTLHVAHTRYHPNYGVSYYRISLSGGTLLDSLFLSGHHSPDLAIDSQGGKYLVSVYHNRVYLSTKDVLLDVSLNHGGGPADFQLGQNFPNPFNPLTRIPYDVLRRGRVEVIVYDALGRIVTQLVNEEKLPGNYIAVWNASTMASGIYFYSLKAMGIVQSRKMILIK